MDLSGSVTRAFLEFHAFHERLNLGIKTSAVSTIFLQEILTKKSYSIDQIRDICYATGSLWGGMPGWGDVIRATNAISIATHDLGCSGVIRAFSAFDVFLETLDAELHAWKEKRKQLIDVAKKKNSKDLSSVLHYIAAENAEAKPLASDDLSEGADDEEDQLGRALRFYSRHSWNLDTVSHLVPVYTYYRRLRNCIAHTNARATPGLVAAAVDPAWASALKKWPSVSADITLPAPYHYTANEEIKITHREALLASSMLRSMAHDMTIKAIKVLGQDGFIHLIASRLLKRKEIIPVGGKNVTSLFHTHIERTYRVKNMNNGETRKIFEQLGHWNEWRLWHHAVRSNTMKERNDIKKDRHSKRTPRIAHKAKKIQ